MIESNKVSTCLKVSGDVSLLVGDQGMDTTGLSGKLAPLVRPLKAVVTAPATAGSNRNRGNTGLFASINDDVRGRFIAVTGRPSAMEVIVASLARISPARGKTLGLLLSATRPVAAGGRGVQASLWNDEATHRAYQAIRLVMLLDLHTEPPACEGLDVQLEHRLASRLADLWRSLDVSCDEQILSCSEVLREIAIDLAELFGSNLAHETIRVHVERLSLPAYKRRALVLLATNLLMEGLYSALTGRSPEPIEVALELVSPSSAKLIVAHDGNSAGGHRHPRGDVINGLIDLLEAQLTYRLTARRNFGTEIEFPIPTPSRSVCADTTRVP